MNSPTLARSVKLSPQLLHLYRVRQNRGSKAATRLQSNRPDDRGSWIGAFAARHSAAVARYACAEHPTAPGKAATASR